jgi:putative membrane protein
MQRLSESVIAYCGPAALPAELWQRWNFDPLLLGALFVLAVWVGLGRSADARAGWAAIALMALIFVAPLCALSSALFSARVLHHVLLVAAVAPLLAQALPLSRLLSPPLALLVALNAVVLWLWHAPGPYAWALASVPAYWLMQATLLALAWLLWRAVLAPGVPAGAALFALATTVGQMGLLGALLVFAPRPLYWPHFESTAAWGFTPLADQQLAGLLMWVPAMLPYLAVGLRLAWSGLRRAGAQPS